MSHTDGSGPRSVARSSVAGRIFAVCGAAFLVAAAIAAIMYARTPFAHGWWLVAYLSLVGGVAQLLLGPGLIALAHRGVSDAQALRHGAAEIVLWNVGTVIVAIADLVIAPSGVVFGSLLLILALALFARELRIVNAASDASTRTWRGLYAVLLVFLAVSTIVGTVLSYSLR